jgi:hypothetical protein
MYARNETTRNICKQKIQQWPAKEIAIRPRLFTPVFSNWRWRRVCIPFGFNEYIVKGLLYLYKTAWHLGTEDLGSRGVWGSCWKVVKDLSIIFDSDGANFNLKVPNSHIWIKFNFIPIMSSQLPSHHKCSVPECRMLNSQIGPHHDGCKSIENLLVCSNSVKQYNFSEECHLAMDLDQKSPFLFFCLAKL